MTKNQDLKLNSVPTLNGTVLNNLISSFLLLERPQPKMELTMSRVMILSQIQRVLTVSVRMKTRIEELSRLKKRTGILC